MTDRIVADTNVLIYYLDKSSVHHKKAVSIIENPIYIVCITTKNISEFVAVLSKDPDISYETILNEFENLLVSSLVLCPSPESIKAFKELLKKYQPKGNRVYDLEIVSIAITQGITKIATLNINDFKNVEEIEVI